MSFFKKYSGPVENPMLRVLSLGAGVQSTVLALKAERGEIGPKPDCAIFADTQWEPKEIYKHLEWLISQLSFPVYVISAGNIKDDTEKGINTTGQRFAAMPFFLSNNGMGRRQRTNEYKIQPIKKKIRELIGLKKRQRAKGDVEQWIGISTDEIQRMKKSSDKWIVNRWPLLEEEMSRQQCIAWFEKNYPGKTLAKSACIGCPYHDNNEWSALTKSEFLEACDFDEKIRNYPKMNEQQFLHSDRIPLREVDLSRPSDHGQLSFMDECEGMCGV